jgi:predicted nucleic acid-binding protein
VAPGVVYLDSSALVKLAIEEVETVSLRDSLVQWPLRMASCIAEVEVSRAASRAQDAVGTTANARELLEDIVLIDVDAAVRKLAAGLGPPMLRSLDAIHMASALLVGSDLRAFVTYDRRLFDAAIGAGLPALAPGQA